MFFYYTHTHTHTHSVHTFVERRQAHFRLVSGEISERRSEA